MEQKLAFSYAIVRSLKLEIVESLLEAALLRLIDIPKQLEMGKFPKASVCFVTSSPSLCKPPHY
jgi:uncharacterized Rmd1/YagE family protein